jgi:hypothetical protein
MDETDGTVAVLCGQGPACNGSEVSLDPCTYFLALSYLLAWAALVLY